MEFNINLLNLPKKQKNIYDLSCLDNLYCDDELDNIRIKIMKDKNYLNIYKWTQTLNVNIEPSDFFYYFKNIQYRNKLNNQISILKEVVNENEWIEEINYRGKLINIKFLCLEYQLIAYQLNSTQNTIFELLNFKIRQDNGKNILILEMAFDKFNIDQEIIFSNQISMINKFEKVIINTIKSTIK
jgi:hypothetical protein